MTRTRIGFIGVGGMGQCAHLKNYVTVPDCEVVALAEIRDGLGQAVAAKYGIPKVYTDYAEMLQHEQLDGIVASQPFTRHGTLISDLAQYGIPIFTEKPLAGAIEQGERILRALAQGGSWHMVGYHKRSDPAAMYAKKEVERLQQTGELGALRYVRILMPAGDWIANGFTDLVRTEEGLPPVAWDPAASDMDAQAYEKYIAFVNYYIHQVNFMRYMLGEPYRVTYVHPSDVLLAVTSDSGVAGVIEMSPYTTSVDWQEQIFVCFEQGWLKIDLPAPLASNRPGTVEIMRDPRDGSAPVTCSPTLPLVHAMRQQAFNFVAAVRGEMPPLCQAAEALEDLKVAKQYLELSQGARV